MKLSPTAKEYVRSCVLSFVTGFIIVVLPQIDSITLSSFSDGTVAGLIFLGVRTGLKGVLEMVMVYLSKKGK